MQILAKVKEKGFKKSVRIVVDKFINYINQYFILIFRNLSIIDTLIVFESEGDYTDNAQALYQYMLDNGYLKKYKIVWLVDYVKNFQTNPLFKNTIFCSKKRSQLHIRTCYYLARCKYYIYDHNNLLSDIKKRNHQVIICLWHGAPFKAATRNQPDITVDEGYTTGKLFIKGSSDFIGCPISKMIDIGYPRNDYLLKKFNHYQVEFIKKYQFELYTKIIFWMPTFRKSINSSISQEYFTNETGLPILVTEMDLKNFSEWLRQQNLLCIFKVHHLQLELPIFKKTYSNILLLKDEMIIKNKLQLYQIMPMADILITDYSSVSVDFMLLDRPIIYTLDDYEEYKKSRGFVFENPISYFAGYHVYNQKNLYDAIEEIVSGQDRFSEERKKVLPQMHTFIDTSASKRILEHLQIEV